MEMIKRIALVACGVLLLGAVSQSQRDDGQQFATVGRLFTGAFGVSDSVLFVDMSYMLGEPHRADVADVMLVVGDRAPANARTVCVAYVAPSSLLDPSAAKATEHCATFKQVSDFIKSVSK